MSSHENMATPRMDHGDTRFPLYLWLIKSCGSRPIGTHPWSMISARVGHDSEVAGPSVGTSKDYHFHERRHLRHDGHPQCRNTHTLNFGVEVE